MDYWHKAAIGNVYVPRQYDWEYNYIRLITAYKTETGLSIKGILSETVSEFGLQGS